MLLKEFYGGVSECKRLIDQLELETLEAKIRKLVSVHAELIRRFSGHAFSLKVLSEILNASGNSNGKNFIVQDIINKSWEKLSFIQKYAMEIEAIKRDMWLEKGKQNYRRGLLDEALRCWKCVLVTDPGNEYIHQELKKIQLDLCAQRPSVMDPDAGC